MRSAAATRLGKVDPVFGLGPAPLEHVNEGVQRCGIRNRNRGVAVDRVAARPCDARGKRASAVAPGLPGRPRLGCLRGAHPPRVASAKT